MEFKLPELGEGVHEGELIQWKVKVGDNVVYDQSLLEIMTDKATIDIPASFSGKILQLQAKEGDMIHVNQVIALVEGENEKNIPSHEMNSADEIKNTISFVSEEKKTSDPLPFQSLEQRCVLAAPSTRRLAREMGMDLQQVNGSGPHGRILKEDLHSFSSAPKSPLVVPVGEVTKMPIRGLRKKIFEKMRTSKDHAAHFTYFEEADATALVHLRQKAKIYGQKKNIKVTYLPFVMKIMAIALKKFPTLNAQIDDKAGELLIFSDCHIGLSIQTEEGLVAPVVKNIHRHSILELAQLIQELVEKARSKRLTTEDFKGGTITLTNVGSIGGLFSTPIINYPEVAILGLNKIFKKPVVKTRDGQDEIVIRDWTYFSMSLDHRVIDGAVAAEFLKYFISLLENPEFLLLEMI